MKGHIQVCEGVIHRIQCGGFLGLRLRQTQACEIGGILDWPFSKGITFMSDRADNDRHACNFAGAEQIGSSVGESVPINGSGVATVKRDTAG